MVRSVDCCVVRHCCPVQSTCPPLQKQKEEKWEGCNQYKGLHKGGKYTRSDFSFIEGQSRNVNFLNILALASSLSSRPSSTL